MASSPHDIVIGATTIHQIRNLTHNTNSTLTPAFATGNIQPSTYFQGLTPHSASVTSTDLSTVLGLNTASFLSIGLSSCSGATPVTVPFRQRENCGTYDTASVHDAIVADRCMITPDSLSGTQGESAQIQFTIRYLSTDSTVSPVIYTGNNALVDATFVSEYMFTGCSINGVAVPEIVSCNVNPGLTIQTKQAGGGVFDTQAYVLSVQPVVEIVTEDADSVLSVINSTGLGTGLQLNFQQRAPNAVLTPATTAAHITVTSVAGLRQMSTWGGSDRDNSQGTIQIYPTALVTTLNTAL